MSNRRLILTFAALACLAAASSTLARDAKPSAAERADKLIAVLKSSAPLKARCDACRTLGIIGDPRAVPVLGGLLADEKLSHMARYALERIADASADAALRDAMGKLTGALRIGVINSIGVRRDAEAVGALTKLLKDPDRDTTAAAVAALGQIATPPAVRALADLRKAPPAPLRAVTADASLAAAERLLGQGQAKDAAAIYEELRAAAWPPHVRLGAFTGLLAAECDEAPVRITEALAGKDTTLRAVAIARIAGLKGPGVAKRFAAELPKLPADAQVLLIGVLAGRGDPAARPAVVKATAHADAKVRAAALTALGVLGDAECVELLCRAAAAAKTDAETQAAGASLRTLSGEGVDAALVRRMQAATPDARAGLIDVLVDRKAAAAVPALMAQAGTKDQRVRSAAIKGLGKLASPKDLPALLQLLLKAEDDATRQHAERAVVAVSRRIADPAAQADAALEALKTARAPAATRSLLTVLARIGNARAYAAVKAALESKDTPVRDAAVRALAEWPDARPLAELLAIFRTAKDPAHRVLALRGCARILSLAALPAKQTLAAYADLTRSARGPDDLKRIIAGMANVADPAALKALEPFLAKPPVRAEAELAMLKVARAIMGSDRDEARAAAELLRKTTKNRTVLRQVNAILRSVQQFEDYITAWQVAGPYVPGAKYGQDVFAAVLPPEKPGAKDVAWRVLPTGGAKQAWMLDLAGALGGENRACCVRTWVHSPKDQPALLEFGIDDGSKVWLNGKLVHADNTGGAAIPGEHKVRVALRKGPNALLLKVTQQTGPWQFCFRIRTPDGQTLPGLRAQASPPSGEGVRP